MYSHFFKFKMTLLSVIILTGLNFPNEQGSHFYFLQMDMAYSISSIHVIITVLNRTENGG